MKKDSVEVAPLTVGLSPAKTKTMEKSVVAKSGKKKRRRAVLSGSIEAMKTQERGIIYLSHIPHGFYETQMYKFFSQFGKISNMKMGRSKRTGNPRGYAFIEFRHKVVAQIVAETMNNYLMFDKLLKCKVLDPEKVRPAIFRNRINPKCPPKVQSRLLARKIVNGKVSEEQSFKRILNTCKRAKKANQKLLELGIQVPVLEILKTDLKPPSTDKKKEKVEKKENESIILGPFKPSASNKGSEKITSTPNLKLSAKLDSSEKSHKKAKTVEKSMDIVKEKKSPTITKKLKSQETNESTATISKEPKQLKTQRTNGNTPEKGNRKLPALTSKIAIEVKTPKSLKGKKGKKVVEEALAAEAVAKTPKKMAIDSKSSKSIKGEKANMAVKEALKPETPEKILLELKTPKSLKAEKSKPLQNGSTPGNKKSKPIEVSIIATPEVKQEMSGPFFPEAKGQVEKMDVVISADVKMSKKTIGSKTNSFEGKTGTPKSKPETTNDDSGKSGKFSAELLNELKRKLTEASGGNVLSSSTPGKKPEANLKKRLSLPATNLNQSIKNPLESSKTPKDIKRKIEKKNLDESINKASTSFSVESAKTPKQAKTDKLTEISQVVKTPKEATLMKPGKSPFTTPNTQKMRRRDSKGTLDNVDLSVLLGVSGATPGKTPSVTPKKTPASNGKKNNSMVMIVDDDEDEITLKTPPNTLKIRSTNNSRANSRIGSTLNTPNRGGGAGSELSLQRGIVEKLKNLHQSKNLTPKSDKKKKNQL